MNFFQYLDLCACVEAFKQILWNKY